MALKALGRIEEALAAHAAAVDGKRRSPDWLTGAGVEFAQLANEAIRTGQYAAALAILDARQPAVLPPDRYRIARAR